MSAKWLLPLVLLLAWPAWSKVVTCPAPSGEPLSTNYQVEVSGQSVAVYTARTLDAPFAGKEWNYGGPYAFANFDADGPVTVRVTAACSLRQVVIQPATFGGQYHLESDHTLVISLPGPRKLSIEPDGKNGPLLLFDNPLETNVPQPDAPGVIYFGPGLHTPGKIVVGSNQTLYLAAGAVVKGEVMATGENIRITGRGILDASDYVWLKGPTPHVVSICGTNVEVSGITIRGPEHWTVVPRNSRHVTVRNIKICGGRVQNDDGIDPCNSQDVLITDCFIRTDDDCVALKGLELNLPNNNVEHITVTNCILWGDRARIFLLGHESRAAFMREITLQNLDIIHFTMTPFLFEPGEEMSLENVTVRDVRIHAEGQAQLMRLRPTVNQYMRNKVPGRIQHVLFRDVEVTGKAGACTVELIGADEKHAVQDVSFENVRLFGQVLSTNSACLHRGNFVEQVKFSGP